MDNVSSGLRAIQTTSSLNVEVIGLPKGCLKIVQIILCLIAFTVVAAFDDSFSFQKNCGNATDVHNEKRTFKFGYPFKYSDLKIITEVTIQDYAVPTLSKKKGRSGSQTFLNDNGVRLPICPDESVESFKLKVSNSDQESSFKFFVFTGVLCFVYGIVVLVAYVFISPTLESHDGIGFKIDVVVHIVLCIFWFCGSFALIRAKNQVAKYTDPDRVLKEIPECVDTDGNGKTTMLCEVTNSPEYRALGFAVGMGFVNLFAWCSNIYFLLKDTPWFELIFNRWSDNPGTSGAAQRYGSNPYGANTTGDSSLPPPADSQHQIPPYNPQVM